MMMANNNALVNNLMNIVFTPISILTLFGFINHVYSVYTRVESILRTVFKEDVRGKVVLITGASSGIGEHLAYEYAKKGACLALVARREDQLRRVAAKAEELGCPYALVLKGDVTNVDDCRHFVNAAAHLFGRLDHLVTNAGVSPMTMFEDIPDITNLAPAMDINFWGSVYSSYFAIPHLKQSRGKIIVVASVASWLPAPRMSFYNASKAALVAMYETLRVELGTQVGITIVTPGLIHSEMTDGKFLNQQGRLQMDKEIRDVQVSVLPLESTAECAKAIVNSACRGDKYLIEPEWYRSLFWYKAFCPDVIEWSNRFYLLPSPGRSATESPSKKVADIATQFTESIFGFLENLPKLATGSFLLDHY
ncbi:11-beta-hydroxysteroid dehydrogenase-like 6 [Linum grandiflorum]